ncbi:hypothetical protein HanRHA438_Chr07g0292321 [Helianthus annuus]|nr:hypothetical protein HanRHA438_Chr07g0292321 [Helianthus annuus]
MLVRFRGATARVNFEQFGLTRSNRVNSVKLGPPSQLSKRVRRFGSDGSGQLMKRVGSTQSTQSTVRHSTRDGKDYRRGLYHYFDSFIYNVKNELEPNYYFYLSDKILYRYYL